MQYAERSGKADVREGCAAVIDVPLSLGPGKIYDLTDGGSNSDGFYLQAEAFTERVEREAEIPRSALARGIPHFPALRHKRAGAQLG